MKFITLTNGVLNLTQEAAPVLSIDVTTSVTRATNVFLATGLTLTPGIGRYMVFGSTSIDTGLVNGQAEVALFQSAVQRTRPSATRQASMTAAILGLITVSQMELVLPVDLFDYIEITSATDTINVQFRSLNGQTITFIKGSLFLVKL